MPKRRPTFQDRLKRRAPAIMGLVVGMVGTVAIVLFASVIYTGRGLGDDPVRPDPVYTTF